MTLAYFLYMLFRMHNFKDDTYTIQEMTNYFDTPDTKIMSMKEHLFVPTVRISKLVSEYDSLAEI